MKTIKLLSLLFISTLIITSCKKDEVDPEPEPLGDYENGFFVVNEGGMGFGNASLTYVSEDYGTIEENVFSNVNDTALGDTAQSVFMYEDKAYIIMNGSNKIEVVNRYTMESITTIEGDYINNPRYMVEHDGFGYVSNWGLRTDDTDDFIAIINLANNEFVQNISVGVGAEKMEIVDDEIYVSLKWNNSINNKIAVIDANTNTLTTEIEVGDVPHSMVVYGSSLFVLCQGYWGVSGGKLIEINTDSNTIVNSQDFTVDEHPEFLNINNTNLYYSLNGKVYTKTIDFSSEASEIESLEGYYYGMKIYDGKIYALDAGDYSSDGELKIYDIENGNTEETITTGIIPNGVVFN